MRDLEDAVEPQIDEPMEVIMEGVIGPDADPEPDVQPQEEPDADPEATAFEKTMVPLSALQKKRERIKELEVENQWLKQQAQTQQAPQQAPQDDSSRYESATREDLTRSQEEMLRMIEERSWIKNNPEKFQFVKEHLPEFLKLKPNYAPAINGALNRYEEAFELMESKYQQKQKPVAQQKTPPAQKRVAPNSPGGVPKGAQLNESVDVMNMSDAEFQSWRKQKQGRR